MRTVKTASKTMGKKRGSSKPYNDGKDSEVAYSLPEHAAQRWIDQSRYNSELSNKLIFGGKYKDPSSKLLPEAKVNNLCDENAKGEEKDGKRTLTTHTSE